MPSECWRYIALDVVASPNPASSAPTTEKSMPRGSLMSMVRYQKMTLRTIVSAPTINASGPGCLCHGSPRSCGTGVSE